MLTVDGLSVHYGRICAVRSVTLHVDRGETVALLGSNGAGKSTLLSTISGLLRPSAGCIRLDGDDIASQAPAAIVARGLVHVPEGRRIFSGLSVLENLRVGAYRNWRSSSDDLDRVFQLFPKLKQRVRQPGGTLSGGEQQMLAIGRALMSKPRLLMLDEPSLGLAPVIVDRLFEQIGLLKQSLCILLVEQNAQLALGLADRGYVMQHGEIVSHGNAHDLVKGASLKSSYLGVAAI